MFTNISSTTRAVGFWSAVLATVFSIAYDIGQIAEWLGWMGSGGGPESSSDAVVPSRKRSGGPYRPEESDFRDVDAMKIASNND